VSEPEQFDGFEDVTDEMELAMRQQLSTQPCVQHRAMDDLRAGEV
jgi:hypothetical protein